MLPWLSLLFVCCRDYHYYLCAAVIIITIFVLSWLSLLSVFCRDDYYYLCVAVIISPKVFLALKLTLAHLEAPSLAGYGRINCHDSSQDLNSVAAKYTIPRGILARQTLLPSTNKRQTRGLHIPLCVGNVLNDFKWQHFTNRSVPLPLQPKGQNLYNLNQNTIRSVR